MYKPSKHSKELAGAIDEDQRRQAVDAAKKRAVAQQADYDTFKKLVSVAHLKPLHAPSAGSAGGMLPAWQLDPNNLSTKAAPTSCSSSTNGSAVAGVLPRSSSSNSSPCLSGSKLVAAAAGEPMCIPRNSAEFSREWRKTCSTTAAKYRLLQACGADAMADIFKVEITGELLAQVLLVLQIEWTKHIAQQQEHSGQLRNDSQQQQCGQLHVIPQQQQQQQQQAAQCHSRNAADTDAKEHCSRSSGSSGNHGACLQEEAVFMVQLLHNLTGAGRFDLNACLIGSKAQQAAVQLCDQLAAALQSAPEHRDKSGSSNGSSSNGGSSKAAAPRGADGQTVGEGQASTGTTAAAEGDLSAELTQNLQLVGPSSSSSRDAVLQQQQQQELLAKLQHVCCKLHLTRAH